MLAVSTNNIKLSSDIVIETFLEVGFSDGFPMCVSFGPICKFQRSGG